MLKQSYKRIHFIGAGGAGVSAQAHLMLQRGYEVTGSDCQQTEVTAGLTQAGATIWQGHDEHYVRLADLVVYSTAIPPENPERAFAQRKGIPVLSRPEMLAVLASRKDSIVVSGSHGKSTTTSMLAMVFIAAQKDPSVVLGSQILHHMGNPRLGKASSAREGKSNWFICEGDESNNSMLEIEPKVAVVTNIDCDHMDFHGSLTNLKNSFIRFLNGPGRKGFSVVCLDDENIRSILPKITSKVVTYGFAREAEYSAQGRRLNGDGTMTFEVHHRERGPLGVINMRFPGDHNVLNSLATVAVCCGLGLSFDNVAFALETFPGVHRRYERWYDDAATGITIIDDYAHHPSEIQALLTAAREVYPNHRIRAVFQPHRFTRSKNLAQEFPQSFHSADEIILAPIYSAQEKPIAGIGVDYLNRFFEKQYSGRRLVCLGELDQIYEYLNASVRPGDLILTIGAGNVDSVGIRLAAALNKRKGEMSAAVDLTRIGQELSGVSMTFSDDELQQQA